jgi:hypothetical protein
MGMEKNDSLRRGKKKEEKFNIKELYTPLSVAKKEIERRWKDKKLREKVKKFLGGDIPKFLKNDPKAVLVRYIISPNYEFFYFSDLAKTIGLDPLYLEYSNDKLVARNTVKYHLCRNIFYNGSGKKGGEKLSIVKLVDFNKFEGEKLCKVKTVNGKNLVNFHHRAIKNIRPKIINKVFDFSKWFDKKRFISKKYYYLYYLTLFICHGVLFENFLNNKEELSFTEKNVIPSFKKLCKIFGVKPLIVPLEPFKEEAEHQWYYYPGKAEKLFK